MEEFYLIIYQICLGLFIGGMIFTVISFILAGLSFETQSELSHDISHDLSHDISHDLSYDISHDLSDDISHDLSHDISHDLSHDLDTDAFQSMSVTPAPAMLLLSCFILFTGALGISLYEIIFEKIIWLIITFTVPYLFTKGISKLWKKIAVSKSYQILAETNLIGKKAIVCMIVDEKGGLIKVPTKSPIEFEKFPAKPLYSLSKFDVDEEVYICDMENNYFLIDKNIESINWRLLKK